MKLKYLLSIALFFVNQFSFSQSVNGTVDTTFNPNDRGFGYGDGPKENEVYKQLIQPDGKILLLGSFANYNDHQRVNIMRINQSGGIDSTFNAVSGFATTTPAKDMALQSDGKIIAVGDFVYFNMVARNRIIRINANGTYDATFSIGAGANNLVNGVAIQPDGKIIIVGKFSSYRGVAKNCIARINTNGTVDNTFNAGTGSPFPSYLSSVAVQPDGKIIITGDFHTFSGFTKHMIARLNPDGSIDNTFDAGSGTNAPATSICIQPDGKIVLGGNFVSVNSNNSGRVCRLMPDGAYDPTFNIGAGFNVNVTKVGLDSSGSIWVSGNFTSYQGTTVNRLARLDSTGVLDTGFSPVFSDIVNSFDIQTDGKLIASGRFMSINNSPSIKVARLHASGEVDSTFNRQSGINKWLFGSLEQTNGKIILYGEFSGYNGVVKNNIVRIEANGDLDPSFTATCNNQLETMIEDQNGNLLVGGNFTNFNGQTKYGLIRLTEDGVSDLTFNPNFGATHIKKIIQQPDGKYILAGIFSSYNGLPNHGVIRLNNDGTIDATFNQSSANARLSTLFLQPDGKMMVCGTFTTYNGVSASKLVRLNPNGTVDNTFNVTVGPDNEVTSAKLLPAGGYVVTGQFTTWNSINKRGLVFLKANGSLDLNLTNGSGIGSEANTYFYDTHIQSNGKILVAGCFKSYNNYATEGLLRLYPNGEVDSSLSKYQVKTYGWGYYQFVKDINLLSDGDLLIAGSFTKIGQIGRNRVARLNHCITPVGYDTLTVCDSLTWINGVTYYASQDSIHGTIITSSGCDSLVYLNLTVNYSSDTLLYRQSCESYYWNVSNQTYYSSQIVIDTIPNMYGCDSIITLNLTIYPRYSDTLELTQCGPYHWNQTGMDYNLSGYYPDTLQTIHGCDSIVTLHFTTLVTGDTVTESVCEAYLWPINAQIYTVSGQYIDTIPNSIGCDSVVTLNLTIYPGYHDTLNVVQCDSYHWNQTGLDYNLSGYYSDSLQTMFGCDSIITLNLTIGNSTADTVIQTACDSYLWPINGQVYTVSGQYIDTIQNTMGCDSVVTLNLTIGHSSVSSEIQTACGSFLWPINGQTYTVSGQYIDTIPNAAGCDSVITLDLTIIPELPLVLENTFSIPSDANVCVGKVAIDLSGHADFELDVDNGSQVITSGGYSLVTDLCAGVHDLLVTDNCGDTLSTQIVIPVDSNYVFNNPFIDSLAMDSLGVTMTNCDIYYAGIDTAYIDSIWANGNMVNVIWNIVDSNGSNFDTTTYVLNNGNGVYWLQLSVFCPNKSVGEYFAVTEAIYFNNGSVSTAGLADYKQNLFEVYPNPTNDRVQINFSGSDAELTVYDLQGKMVLKEQIENQETISLKHFERGVYLFNFKNSQGKSVQRVVKQ